MQKPSSIKQIAKLAGCSTATVSHVLNNKGFFSKATKEKILRIVKEQKYVPNLTAKSLRTGLMQTIGVVFYKKNSDVFDNLFYLPILNKLQTKLSSLGYDLLLADFSDEMIADGLPPSVVTKGKADGIILLGCFPEHALKLLTNIRQPVVVLDNDVKTFDSLFSDNFAAEEHLVDELVKLGHRRIVFMRRDYPDVNTQQREDGFLSGVKKNKLSPQYCFVSGNSTSREDACAEMENILKSSRAPTAVIASNDDLAVCLMNHVQSKGFRVPQDISFIGFDNTNLAKFTMPALASVKVHSLEMAEYAAELIVRRIKDSSAPIIRKSYDTEFVLRPSVASI